MMKNYFWLLIFSCFGYTAFGQISGSVFRDYNGNGIKDASEPLVNGVIVSVFTASGQCGTATTSGTSAPNYTIAACSGDVRIEFVIPDAAANTCGLSNSIEYSANNGATYGSAVQFATAPATANFAVGNPAQYASSAITNPKLFTSCYVSGDNLGTGNVGDADAFVSVDYNPTGNTTPAPAHYANTRQVGSTWGVAYSKQCKKVFTSAVLKRHTGLGPLGSGGIYLIDPTIQLPDLTGVTNFLDFDAIGIPTRGTGTYAGDTSPTPLVAFSDIIGSNAERNLGMNTNTGERDAQVVAQAARVSFGDLDISDDGRYLYIMNLYDRRLYQIDLTDPLNPVAPTLANKATKIKSWAIPEPCMAGTGVARPWGIDYYRGEPYIGVVCDASVTEVSSDLNFTIYSLDVTSGTFSSEFTSALDFPRGISNGFAGNASSRTGWFGWTDDWDKIIQGTGAANWPQPILSDLEFDTDGSMILGFMDRTGLQGGWNNFGPVAGVNTLYLTMVGGDLLRAYKRPSDCAWELESAGKEGPSSPKAATGGASNGEGPGGGEFYYEEFFASQHRETALGGVGILFGSGDVVATIYDPFRYDSFGLGWFDNTTGKKDKGFEVFFTNNNFQMPVSGTFSKGLSLGDIEVEEELPPVEIGNRVWLDTNNNGIQDAGEAGIAGVNVELYNPANTTVIATATTDANGNYIFSTGSGTSTNAFKYGLNLTYGTNYQLRIVGAQGGSQQTPLATYSVTSKDADATANGDARDNDGTVADNSTIDFTLGTAGQNNHSYDFGFRAAPACTIPVPMATTPCASTNIISNGNFETVFGNNTFNDDVAGIAASFLTKDNTQPTGNEAAPSDWSNPIPNPFQDKSDYNGIFYLNDNGNKMIWIRNGAGSDQCLAPSVFEQFPVKSCTEYSINFKVAGWSPLGIVSGSDSKTDFFVEENGGVIGQWNRTPYQVNSTSDCNSIVWINISFTFTTSGNVQGPVDLGLLISVKDDQRDGLLLDNFVMCEIGPGSLCTTMCTTPSSITTTQTAPTCTSATPNNNGVINVTAVTGSDKYGVSTGGTYTGPAYATATALPALPFAAQSMIPNTGGTYTIRFFNGDNACFVDEVVTVAEVVCTPCPVTNYQLCPNETYTLTTDPGLTNIQWFRNGTMIPGATNMTYVATQIGTYTYTADQSASGCSGTLCCPIEIIAGTSCCTVSGANPMTTCNDARTGSTPADDYFTVTLNPIGNGIGTTYSVSGGITANNIPYGSAQQVGGQFLISNGNLNITITDDASGATCQLTNVSITAPAPCSVPVDRPTVVPPGIVPPCHVIDVDLRLGLTNVVDDTLQTAADDGLTPVPAVATPGNTLNLEMEVYNNKGVPAYLVGWIDWNGNGVLDPATEEVISVAVPTQGTSFVPVVINIPTTVPQNVDIVSGFRLSTQNGLGPYGETCAPDGEYENYLFRFDCPAALCLPVTITKN